MDLIVNAIVAGMTAMASDFLKSVFLLGLAAVAIPIGIALWRDANFIGPRRKNLLRR